jgi:hypothetical protein
VGAKTRKTAEATEVIDLEWDGESKDALRSRCQRASASKMVGCQFSGTGKRKGD